MGMEVLRGRVWTSCTLSLHQNLLGTFKNHPHLGATPDLNQNLGVGTCRFSSLHTSVWCMASAEHYSFVRARLCSGSRTAEHCWRGGGGLSTGLTGPLWDRGQSSE